jgi:hypothetical protein
MENTLMPGILMGMLSLACIIIVLSGLQKVLVMAGFQKDRRSGAFNATLAGIILWLTILGILSFTGFFSNFSALPPRLLLVLLIGFFIALLITFSKGFTRLLKTVPPHWLVYFQSFRIAVELLLWLAFSKGLIPGQMTFEGYNFDVVTGILALPVGWLLSKRKPYARTLGIIFNIIGLLLLLNIITIAVLSMPTPFRQFMNEPANTIVATFPFIYLPGVLVVLAFSFHVFSLRQLIKAGHLR